MNSRLVAVASRLSSPHAGERSNAISLIEKLTGEPFSKALEPGVRQSFSGEARDRILKHLTASDRDQMIRSIGEEIRAANLTWQAVFSAKPAQAGLEILSSSDSLLAKFFAQCWDKARPLYGDLAPYRAPSGLREVPRRHLPVGASVRPTLVSRGMTMGQAPYATFRLTGWTGDEEVAFLGTFIAHGAEWISKLSGLRRGQHVAITFHDNGDPVRLVEIKPAS